MDKTPWLVIDYSKKPNELVCERCGDRYPFQTPVRFSVIEGLMAGFTKAHKNCKEKPIELFATPIENKNRKI